LKDYSANKDLYIFLASLPKDSLIAAFPDTADGIPVFSKRRVFINEEMSVPLFDRYWETIKGRTFDFFGAYYAARQDTVSSFAWRNGITHLVIERRRYSRDFIEGNVYFEPFGSWIKGRFRQGQHFYLQGIPDKACVFVSGETCVIRTDTLRSAGAL
jgi:hypothetical protein